MTQNGKRTKTDKNTEHILEIQKKNKKTFGTYVYIYIYIHILDIKKKEKQEHIYIYIYIYIHTLN